MFRRTPQRQAVLDVLRDARDHPTAAQVLERVHAQQPGLGAATVYRTLGLLVADGQARQLSLGDAASARYDANVDRHDHVVCTECGVAMDVECPMPDETMEKLAARTGFDLVDYDLEFRRRCPSCQQQSLSH